MQHLAPQAIRMDNIVGARQQIIPRMGVISVMSRPLRGCSTTTTSPRRIARTSVRSTARTSSWSAPLSVGRCSGSRNSYKKRTDQMVGFLSLYPQKTSETFLLL